MARWSRTCVVLVAAVSVLAGPLAAEQQPVFSSATRTVPVYATVTDRSGRIVPGLDRSAFQIFDNGAPQDITVFANDPVPFAAALTLDTSASMTANIEFVQEAAVQFVLRMLPQDEAVINFFNSKSTMSPGLSSDRDGLARYIKNEMTYGNETRLWDAMNTSMNVLDEAAGRKVVVALTDGEDFGSRLKNSDVMERAQREDVMIYAIGIESYFHNGVRWTLTRPGGAFRRTAEETGGGFFELKKTADLNSTFTRVVQELRSQYVLGFTPRVLDGKPRKIEVRVAGQGLTARARKSYVAAR